jgi:hypothetical protein
MEVIEPHSEPAFREWYAKCSLVGVHNTALVLTYPDDGKRTLKLPGNKYLGHLLRIIGVLSALAFLALFASLALMFGIGHWLVKQDSLQPANAIAVLSGHFPDRALEAARLYRAGYAKEIWLTNPGTNASVAKELGIHFPSEADFNTLLLKREGVPQKAIHILESPIVNTDDELDVIGDTLEQKGRGTVIIVTDKAHTRRVHELWTRYAAERGTLIVHGISDDDFNPNGWWRDTDDTHQVIHEMLGMINVWAGKPMRTHGREKPSLAGVNPPPGDLMPEESTSNDDAVEQE